MPLTRAFEPFFYTIVARKIKAFPWPCSNQKDLLLEERRNDLTFLKRGIRSKDLETVESKPSIKSTRSTEFSRNGSSVASYEADEM